MTNNKKANKVVYRNYAHKPAKGIRIDLML